MFLSDLATKALFFSETYAGNEILGDAVSFVLHKNTGISFNIPIPQSFILLTTAVVLIGIVYLLLKTKRLNRSALIGLALIFGGAVGNALDRLLFEYVRDWLLLFGRSAINLADTGIILGMALFLFSDRGTKRADKAYED